VGISPQQLFIRSSYRDQGSWEAVYEKTSLPRIERGSQFGLEKLLRFFGLLSGCTGTDLNRVRHRLG